VGNTRALVLGVGHAVRLRWFPRSVY
jgi:hypothetical protein